MGQGYFQPIEDITENLEICSPVILQRRARSADKIKKLEDWVILIHLLTYGLIKKDPNNLHANWSDSIIKLPQSENFSSFPVEITFRVQFPIKINPVLFSIILFTSLSKVNLTQQPELCFFSWTFISGP